MTTKINYYEIRSNADAAIVDAGQPGFLRRTTTGSGADPWNPGSGTVTDYPIVFVVVSYPQRDKDGTLIQQTDQQALIKSGGLTVTPTDDFQLVDSTGNVWEIVTMEPISPAGIPVLYQAQIRR